MYFQFVEIAEEGKTSIRQVCFSSVGLQVWSSNNPGFL